MANWNEISTIKRLVRALLKDRLRIDGRDVFSYFGDSNFSLSEDYPSATGMKVYKNGTILSTGWSYNTSTNIVTVSATLATNDTILITYSYYDKYSESELTDYIEASFSYFAQFGYRKLFKLNEDRDIVLTVDGINPTARECYEIAIIAAICVDPQNIEIRTKDFTISAVEKDSKIELIQKALIQFTTWYGEFTWDEDLKEDVA